MEDMRGITNKVGELIRHHRRNMDMTQEKLAATTGFSRSKIVEIERGWGYRKNPHGEQIKTPYTPEAEDLIKIANIIGADADALLDAAGYNSKDYSTMTALRPGDLADLTQEEMRIVRAVLRALREARYDPPTR